MRLEVRFWSKPAWRRSSPRERLSSNLPHTRSALPSEQELSRTRIQVPPLRRLQRLGRTDSWKLLLSSRSQRNCAIVAIEYYYARSGIVSARCAGLLNQVANLSRRFSTVLTGPTTLIRNDNLSCGKVFPQPHRGITDCRSLSWALRHHWVRSAAQSG